MIEHVFVWFLLVRSTYSSTYMPVQMGPYSTLLDCKRIQGSVIFKPVSSPETQCIQVSIPVQTLSMQQGVKK